MSKQDIQDERYQQLNAALDSSVEAYAHDIEDIVGRIERSRGEAASPEEHGLRLIQHLHYIETQANEAKEELCKLLAQHYGVSGRALAKAAGVSQATMYRMIDTTKKNERTGS